jgi:hypothetical protein
MGEEGREALGDRGVEELGVKPKGGSGPVANADGGAGSKS